jgi:outer membrane protein assembly factor BamA
VILGIVSGGLALAVGAFLARGYLEERARRSVESRASRAIGGTVKVSRLRFSFFPAGVRLEGVRVEKRGNRGSEATGEAEVIAVRAEVLTLIGARRGPAGATIARPRLRVVLAERREAAGAGPSLIPPEVLAALPAGSSLAVNDGEIEFGVINGVRGRLAGVRIEAEPEQSAAARGRFEFTAGELHGLGGEWSGLRGDGAFRVAGRTVGLDPVSILGDGFALAGRGEIVAGAAPSFGGAIDIGADVEKLARLLPAGAAPAGRLDARLAGSWRPGEARLQGNLEAVALRAWGVEAGSLRCDVRIDEGVRFRGIRAHLFGGQATGSIDIVGAEPGSRAEIDVRVDGVDLAQILEYAGWGGPRLSGTLHYRGRHQVDSSGLGSLRGSGVIDGVGHFLSRRGADVPLEVTSSLATEGDTILMKGGTIRAGSTRGSFSGTIKKGDGVRLRLSGATGNISEILPLFAQPPSPPRRDSPSGPDSGPSPPERKPADEKTPPLRLVAWRYSSPVLARHTWGHPAAVAAPPPDAPGADARPADAPESALERVLRALGGRWEWEGDLSYGPDGLAFEGALTGAGLNLEGTDVGALVARVVYRDETLAIEEAALRLPDGGEVRLRGSVAFRDPGSIAIEARAEDYPLGPILSVAGIRLPIEGRFSGGVRLSGRPGAPSGRATFEAGPVSVAGVAFDDLEGDLLFTPDLLETGRLVLSQGSGRLTLSGGIPYRDPGAWLTPEKGEPRRVSITGEGIDLAPWSRAFGLSRLEGTAALEGSMGGSLAAPEGSLVLRADRVGLGDSALGALTLEADLAEDRVDFRIGLPDRDLTIDGRIGLHGERSLSLHARFAGLALGGREIMPDAPEEARVVLSGEAEVHGPLGPGRWRELTARADLRSARFEIPGVRLEARDPVEVILEAGRLRLGPVFLVGPGTEIELHALLDAAGAGTIDAAAGGAFDLQVLRLFLKDLQVTGRGEARLEVRGEHDRPVLRGTIQVTADALRHTALPFPVTDLRGRAVFEESGLRIEALDFRAGGGEVTGNGEIVLGDAEGRVWPPSIRKAEIRFQGKEVRAEFPGGFRSVSDLEVALRKDGGAATLSGQIDVVRGVYSRDFRLESSLAGRRPPGLFEVKPPEGPLASLRLDLRVRAAGDVWLRNDFASLEGEGEIEVGGTAARPTLAGRITALEGGAIRFRNVPYRVETGTIDFDDPQAINPVFDLQAETRVADYQVTLRVEGTVDEFRYELSSDPPLPQQDIVALLLTGRTLGAVDPQTGGGLAEETVSSYLAGRLTEELAGRLSGKAGFDLFVIDPLQVNGQGDPAARVTLGKQVTPDLFVAYSTELGTNQGAIYQLDYSLTRDFHFTSLRDRDGSVGGDFKFIRRGRVPSPPDLGSPAPATPEIASVRLEGETRFAEGRIHRRLRLRPGRPRDRAAVNAGLERVLQFYRDRGFLAAEAEWAERPAGPAAVDLVISIRPGPRLDIRFEGIRGREGLRRDLETLWQAGVIPGEMVEEARQRLLNRLRDRGYLSAEVTAQVLADGPEEFRALFSVRRGPRVRAESVSVSGSGGIPAKEVLGVLETSADSLFSRGIVRLSALERDREAIRELYLSRGFPAVAVADPEVILDDHRRRASVTFRIEEGPRITVRAVSFEGNAAVTSERLERVAGIAPGSPYTGRAADEAALALRREYDGAGFPDAEVRVRSLAVGRGDPSRPEDLVFLIEEGKRQTVGRIEIAGNALTRDHVLRKALAIRPGGALSRRDLLASQTRLYRRGIFRSVSVGVAPPPVGAPLAGDAPPAAGPPGPRPVRGGVRGAAPQTPVFGIGYDSEESLRGQYEISNRNVFGSGRYLGLQTRASDLERRASLSYRDYGIFGGRFDALASAFLEDERSPAFEGRTIGSSIQLSRRLSRATRTLYRYTLKDVDITNAVVPPSEPTTRLSSLAVSAVHDTRDALFDPLRGHYLSGEVQFFGRSIGSEAGFTKMYAQIFLFKEVLPRTVWAQAFRAGAAILPGRFQADPALTSDGSGLLLSERFFAGGDTSVRGFRRDRLGPLEEVAGTRQGSPLGGEGVFLINQELRFPIYRFLQGVLFYDAGNVYNTLQDFDLSNLRHVAGAGLRLATPIGPFRLEYGAILDREPGDESRGEFFISIGQAF